MLLTNAGVWPEAIWREQPALCLGVQTAWVWVATACQGRSDRGEVA